MLDTVGPELQVVNRGEKIIELKGDGLVILTPDQGQEPSSELLPINFDALSKVWQICRFIMHLHKLFVNMFCSPNATL